MLTLLGIGFLLFLIQVVAALPWLAVVNWDQVQRWLKQPASFAFRRLLVYAAGVLIVGALGPAVLLLIIQDADTLRGWGRVYGAVLHLQLAADFFVAVFGLLALVWPKGAAVALSAFREGLRQPMFWLFILGGLVAIAVFLVLPYFTFGEDFIMMKQIDYDIIMILAAVFGVLAASMSISEEIEGRTAVTLMSKPVSRRQFLVGKFVGILLAALVMSSILSWVFDWSLLAKRYLDRMDPVPPPEGLVSAVTSLGLPVEASAYLMGCGLWFADAWEAAPGLLLGFCQVMVLTAVAAALATRLPVILNVPACGVIYFLGNLTSEMVAVANRYQAGEGGGSVVGQMLGFVARLFDTLVPRLGLFSLDPALVGDAPLPTGPFLMHLGSAALLGTLYTLVALIFGLILFEDRDLA
ncbi:MAG TPA: ABC transporter permease [Gemmataceae bacterium]|nr:ABC transporter permease [Gemmataceae bacterium]